MNTLIFNNGKTIEFEKFLPAKANLIKVSLRLEDWTEGIWACIADKDKKDYDNNVSDMEAIRVCILQNDAVMGAPCGCFLPMQFVAGKRPICCLDDLTGDVQMADEVYAQ